MTDQELSNSLNSIKPGNAETQEKVRKGFLSSERPCMKRGFNMGNMLEAPNEGEWGTRLEDDYLRVIAEHGFDHARIPIRWNAHTEEAPPYAIKGEFLARVDHVVGEALKLGLTTVINIHHFDALHADPEGQRLKFLSIWEQLSDHYKAYPQKLVFEPLNEPHGKFTDEIWNALLLEAIKIIRVKNPDRMIMIEGIDFGILNALRRLRLPEGDKNLIASIHNYNPMDFTHSGTKMGNPEPKRWPDDYPADAGTIGSKAHIAGELDVAQKWSEEHGIHMNMGEFGNYRGRESADFSNGIDIQSRVNWTGNMIRECEKRGISWTYWEFCSGFGVYDKKKKEFIPELLAVMMPEEK